MKNNSAEQATKGYISPRLEIVVVATERGFASSSDTPDSDGYTSSDNGEY